MTTDTSSRAGERVPNTYEQAAREKKCRLLARFFLDELANALSRPESASMWTDAAREAGVNEPSPESQKRILEMLREK